jgi:hypothetical protein
MAAAARGFVKGARVEIIAPPHNSRRAVLGHAPFVPLAGRITREGSSANGGWFEIAVDGQERRVYFRRGALRLRGEGEAERSGASPIDDLAAADEKDDEVAEEDDLQWLERVARSSAMKARPAAQEALGRASRGRPMHPGMRPRVRPREFAEAAGGERELDTPLEGSALLSALSNSPQSTPATSPLGSPPSMPTSADPGHARRKRRKTLQPRRAAQSAANEDWGGTCQLRFFSCTLTPSALDSPAAAVASPGAESLLSPFLLSAAPPPPPPWACMG